ncbi:glycosyltransferase family 4 protein [Chitinivibrio alkaliphilus]|uniref:Glycosyl transferase, group 1 family protein n=1 Tax=Chitinivibrio alkaliphilus ACht1 TaxID=1313304 RepID=U7D4H4_9BACT|nr:glycosyltransferase family 4 protein [Chitinivibrio alkaliphilus]ERP31404.1 glycosyl transferase, group 1 family protein [Chitinivibrio alkaliphilus ACht1]
MKILMIADFPPPEGGVTILVKALADYLKDSSECSLITYDIMQKSKRKGISFLKPFDNIYTLIKYLVFLPFFIHKADVITLHLPTTKIITFAIPALLWSKVMGKPIILRKFGGTNFYSYSSLKRALSHFVARSVNLYCAETKTLIESAMSNGITNAQWFPNNRIIPSISRENLRDQCSEFVYVGQIREEKGLAVLSEALSLLPEESPIHVTLYGSICDNVITEEFINKTPHMKYGGSLPSDKVHETIAKYDCFVFPTFWHGEGYPGALIEALSIGLPAIISDWGAVGEVTDATCSVTVPVKDPKALAESMMFMYENVSTWRSMTHAAKNRGSLFDTNRWSTIFLGWCQDFVTGGKNVD